MPVKLISLFFLSIIVVTQLQAQTSACSTLGQTPATAFPLCTKDTFTQSTVPICTNRRVNVPGCGPATGDYADKNPFWYRFTCYQAGTLGFMITPNDLSDDYDWQLYDITAVTDLNAVYTNAALFVVGNWSGSAGVTGAAVTGTHVVECASAPADNINTFSVQPVLQLGHTYLLMVSHYSDNQSGYKLSFIGGTAVINDPRLPDLQKLQPSCDATVITLKLDSKMKCNSLATDGSDFMIVPAAATVIAATGAGCSSSFDMDSVTLILSNPLPPGSYSLSIKKGRDANTLLDDCDRDIPAGHQLPFVITPLQPTPLDSISPVKCAPSQLELVFKKHIRCNSIAADGSDFIITGPAPVTVLSAAGVCNNDLSYSIILKLAAPVVKGGIYQVAMKPGSDGNTVIDECGQRTPAGSAVSFTVKDTVSADFNYKISLGCRADTIEFLHDALNGVNQWLWVFDAAGASSLQGKAIVFTTFGQKQISLIVSNGFCSDSIVKTISLNNELDAAFETSDLLCPEDAAGFKNNSKGDIIGYSWNFGNGNTSLQQLPVPQNYPKIGAEKTYPVQLIVENTSHCFDTATSKIKVLKTCYIAVPNAFTPNGDLLNDYLYPLNAFKADNLEFNVYNRLGQLVFHTINWTKKWDGTVGGHIQSAGTYVWTLRYTNRDTGKKIFLKGSSILIR
ncbi:MAG: gliding motility-associated C-terminal domain-containing protein [Chitinophagaceae bacterium]